MAAFLDDDDVGVPVAVQIGDHHAGGRPSIAGKTDLRAQGTERAVAVVVQQLARTIALDEQQVDIAVVIGIEHRAVNRDPAGAFRTRGPAHVRPSAFLGLSPQLIRSTPAQVDVGEAIVVVVAPECGVDVGDRRRRMRSVDDESIRAPVEQQGIAPGAAFVKGSGDEQVELSIAVHVGHGHRRRLRRVVQVATRWHSRQARSAVADAKTGPPGRVREAATVRR